MSIASFKLETTIPTPPAGYVYYYAKTDKKLYFKDDTGTEYPVKPVGGGTGDLLSDGSVPLTANWDVGAFLVRALQFESDIATGTAPFVVASTTMVANLNAALLGGKDLATIESDYAAAIAAAVIGLLDHKGGYDADTNTPDLDTAPSGIKKGDVYIVTVAGTFYAVALEVGDSLIANQDDPTASSHWTIVQGNLPAGVVLDADFPSEGLMRATNGTGGYAVVKTNLGASVDPTVTDDSSAGYGVFSPWVNTTASPRKLFFCTNPAPGAAVWIQVGSGAGGLTPAYKSANYTAVAGEIVYCDSSGGAFAVTLPASPSDKQQVTVVDAKGSAATNNITIGRNGQTINGAAADFVIDQNFGQVALAFDATAGTWKHALTGGATPGALTIDDVIGKETKWIPITDMYVMGSGVPGAEVTIGAAGANGQFRARPFDDTSEEAMAFTWVVPQNYKVSAGISFIAYWSPAGTSTGNVQWELRGLPYADGETIDSTIVGDLLCINDAGNGAAGKLQISPLPTNGPKYDNDFNKGEIVCFRCARRPSGALEDTLVGDAYLIGIQLIYWTDAPTED